jgi:choloylglycine hydrolase
LGWNKFAQGGINEYGLFFDGATTPKQILPEGYTDPKGRNEGDELLAYCKNVQEALDYLEKEKIAISEGHLFLGDTTGYAVIAEWVEGKRIVHEIQHHRLIATNTILCDTTGLKNCYRFQKIEEGLQKLDTMSVSLNLKTVGQVIAGAVQPPRPDSTGRTGGTLYTNFICWQTGELIFIYRLDNTKKFQWSLKEWNYTKRRKCYLS